MLDVWASSLRMTPNQMLGYIGMGRSINDLARMRRVQPQTLVNSYRTQMNALLQSQVGMGWMTPAQADWMLDHMTQQAQWIMGHSRFLQTGWQQGPMMGFGWGYGDLMQTAARVLHLTPWELMVELQSGQTLRQVAEAKNVNPEDIIAAYRDQVRQALNQAVNQGRLTQADADSILAELEAQARWFLDNTVMMSFGWGYGQLIATSAQVLNNTPQVLVDQLRAGRTITQVAQEKGVPTQRIVDAYLAPIQQAVNQAVAAGHLTQAQATQIIADITQRAEWLLTQPFMLGFAHGHMTADWGHGGCH